jgi:hypothetical protein
MFAKSLEVCDMYNVKRSPNESSSTLPLRTVHNNDTISPKMLCGLVSQWLKAELCGVCGKHGLGHFRIDGFEKCGAEIVCLKRLAVLAELRSLVV